MTFTIDKVNPGVPSAEVALWKAIPILSDLVNDAHILASHVLPLVEEPAEDWYVAYHHDAPSTPTLCRSSSGLRVLRPESTTIPHGEPSVASWDPFSKNVTSASITARYQITPA